VIEQSDVDIVAGKIEEVLNERVDAEGS